MVSMSQLEVVSVSPTQGSMAKMKARLGNAGDETRCSKKYYGHVVCCFKTANYDAEVARGLQ